MSVSMLVRTAAALIGALALQPVARAIPIGDFSWSEHNESECEAGLCGPYFSVTNFSDMSFLDVFVDLETDTVLASLSLGEIAAGAASQSIDDLLGLSIFSASLRLTFAAPGSFQLLDFDGNPVAALTAPGALLIDFTAAESVPEPATAFLFATGLLAAGLGRKARQHTTTSRMKSAPAVET